MQELLVLRCDYADLKRLDEWIAALEAAAGLGERDRFRIELVLTELVTNIMDSALPAAVSREVRIRADVGPQAIAFEVTDEGRPFNLLEVDPRALPARLEDALPGGHGIRLIRSYSDDIRYERVGSMNRLTLSFQTSGARPGA